MAILEDQLKSYDADFISLFSELEQEHTTTSLESALHYVTLDVAEILLRQEAILLPEVCDMLINRLYQNSEQINDQVSRKYLFSQ